MKLYYSPPSPFSRKVRIVAALLGLDAGLELIVSDTLNPEDLVRLKNPLGKIPILERDDGVCVYDSAVIAAYLDALVGGGKVIPLEREARFAALTLEALADGLTDACILQVYETRLRSENERSPSWLEHQKGKVSRALASLEAAPPVLGESIDVGQVALACALGYLDLRFAGAWRPDHPRLVAWMEAFAAKTPSFAATAPQ